MDPTTDPQTADAEDIARIWALMEKERTAFLITQSQAGPHARPMSPIVRQQDGLVWFLTQRETMKQDEIEEDRRCGLLFTDGGSTHLAISGTATIIEDRAVIEALWSKAAQAFYPQGPGDPSIVAIRAQPAMAELWDGPSTAVALVQMAAALATGTSAADMGHNVTARMD